METYYECTNIICGWNGTEDETHAAGVCPDCESEVIEEDPRDYNDARYDASVDK